MNEKQAKQIEQVKAYWEGEARRAVRLYIEDGYITYSELGELLQKLHQSEVAAIIAINNENK